MTLRLSKIVGFLLLFSTISFTAIHAQGYSLLVKCPESLSGRLICTLYNDSTTSTFRPRIQESEVTLSGELQHPSLMQISHPKLPQPLFFYLENANIVITLDPKMPNTSPITGSRTNSQYRYALEINNPDNDPDWLTALVQDNPNEIYTPFILSQYISSLPFTTLERLYKQLSGVATSTYHYRKLTQQIQRQKFTLEGSILPDFIFNDTIKHSVHFDSIHSNKTPSIILFTASWCKQCNDISQQIKENYPQLQLISVPIDAHPKHWDAPYLKQLSVDRIPYMILIDEGKRILTRDVRIWELQRLLTNFQLNLSTQP